MARSGLGRTFLRRTAQFFTDKDKWASVQATNGGDVCIVQSLPPESELVRLGSSWGTTGTAFTQTAFFNIDSTISAVSTIYNLEPDNGKCYLIESIGAESVVNPATPDGLLSFRCALSNLSLPAGAPANPLISMKGLSGRNYNGKAKWFPQSTTTSALTYHFAGTSILTANTVILTLSNYLWVFGRYIVPPGGLFSFYIATPNSANASFSYIPSIFWHEVQIPFG